MTDTTLTIANLAHKAANADLTRVASDAGDAAMTIFWLVLACLAMAGLLAVGDRLAKWSQLTPEQRAANKKNKELGRAYLESRRR